MKRTFDILLSSALILISILPITIIYLLVFTTSRGPAIYWSKRVGKNNKIFNMPKFRTMKLFTPELPTDQLTRPQKWLTPVGKILRKSSLDELPQLFSVLNGDMSLVGPRPALQTQKSLIQKRTEIGIHKLTPGITGWAQINGRDSINEFDKLGFDEYYMQNCTINFDLKILFLTIFKIFKIKDIK